MPPTIEFASLGMADSLILMVLALVVFGPRRLPQIGRQIGKLMFEFRKASNDFKFQMEEELRSAEDADRRKQEEERQRALALNAPAQPADATAEAPPTVNAIESPYTGEGQYPELTASEAARAEEGTPRILPPSTGVQVPATRPSRLAGLTEPASESGAAAQPDATAQAGAETEPPADAPQEHAATEQTAAGPEAVSHNG